MNYAVDVQLLNVENHWYGTIITCALTYLDGSRRTSRLNVKALGTYYGAQSGKSIASAVFLKKVYCGIFRNDVRMLFAVKLDSGMAQLMQVREGSSGCTRLLQLSKETASGPLPPTPPAPIPSKSYPLGKNELPQGEYLIGRDIPAGTYDFFVIYGTGGKFDLAQYDDQGAIINGTWDFHWVGLKEDHEARELIHVECKEGYTVKISGNVILRIVKSQPVKIEL